MELKSVEAAYCTGLIDGEGSIVLAKCSCKDKKYMGKRGFVWEPRISIGMADTEGLEFLKQLWNKKRLRVSPRGGKNRVMFYLTLYSNGIREYLPQILPYLKVKKEQALLLLEVVTIIKPKSSLIVDNRLEEIYLEMKKLPSSLLFFSL